MILEGMEAGFWLREVRLPHPLQCDLLFECDRASSF